MNRKEISLIVCVLSFIAGSLFLITNPEVTGNVIGATQSGYTLSGIMGIIIITVSLGIFTLNLGHNGAPQTGLAHITKREYDRNKTGVDDETKDMPILDERDRIRKQILRQELDEFKRIGDNIGIATVFKEIGDAYKDKNRIDDAKRNYGKAMELALRESERLQKEGKSKEALKGYIDGADIGVETENIPYSRMMIEKAANILKYSAEKNDGGRDLSIYNNAATIAEKVGDMPTRAKFLNRAKRIEIKEKNYRAKQ